MASSSKKPANPANVSPTTSRIDLNPTPSATQDTKDDDDISMLDADKNIMIENVKPLKVALLERYSGNRAELETFLL
jgi:hypothetical protein